MKKIFIWILLLTQYLCFSQSFSGSWEGSLTFGGQSLQVIFNIEETENGWMGTMDVPAQSAKAIPLNEIRVEDNRIVFSQKMTGIQYEGTLTTPGHIEGTFRQSGMEFPLSLKNVVNAAALTERVQDPTPPFPYVIENVRFPNQKEFFSLAGTLTLPSDQTIKHIAILISGSGPQDRNSEIFNHRPFLILADALTRSGIAVLRYDDRGTNESEGNFDMATSMDFAEDVRSAITFIKTRKDLKGAKITLIGHSEGGMIAPMVAANNPNVYKMVLLAAPGVPIDELLLEQSYLIGKASGLTESQLLDAKELNKKLYDKVIRIKDRDSLRKELKPVFEDIFSDTPEENREQTIRQQLDVITSNWFTYFIRYNPETFLSKVTCPILALNGEKDLQVAPESNINGIKKIVEKSGNKELQYKIYPQLNHLFQTAVTGSVMEYGTLEETFNEEVIRDIIEWIR